MSAYDVPTPVFRWLRTVNPPQDHERNNLGCHADSWPEGPREYLVLQQQWQDGVTGEAEWRDVPVVEA